MSKSNEFRQWISVVFLFSLKMVRFSYIFLLCVPGLCTGTNDIHTERVNSNSTQATLDFINEARNKFNLTNNANIILVVGKTGVGKSTFVHYIAGDYSKIIASEPVNPYNLFF